MTLKSQEAKSKAAITAAFLMGFLAYHYNVTDYLQQDRKDKQAKIDSLAAMTIDIGKENDSLKSEITYMLIHGLLHLLGYDHELSQKEEKLMFRLQDECFEAILG